MKRMVMTLAAFALVAGFAAPLSAQAFGNAMVIDDGQIFVGEPTYDMRSGVVYVFEEDGSGNWVKAQRLEPASGERENRFGIRLAKQDDVLLVSATRADDGTGAIYVFRDQGGTWTESGRLEVDDRSPADSLGSGLAIDGDWVMIGTIGQNEGKGAAYVFKRDGDGWTQHQKITRDDLTDVARFGVDIAVSDGRMLISAIGQNDGAGAVFSYRYNESTDLWNAVDPLEAPLLEENTTFGSDLALSGDFALVGAPGLFSGLGSVLMFGATPQGAWQLITLLTPFETTGGTGFGSNIAFDGETALIGASGAGRGSGRVFAYTLDRSTMEWSAATQFGSGSGGREAFASGVAAGDGRAVAAALGADRGAGAAYVLARGPDGWAAGDRIVGDVLGFDAVMGDEETMCSDEGAAADWECSSVDLVSFLPVGEMGADRGIGSRKARGPRRGVT